MEMFAPSHPGEILKEIFSDYNVTQIAQHLNVSRVSVSKLLNGRCSITPKMAAKLEKAIPHSSMEFWLNLQQKYDIAQTRNNKNLIKELKNIKPFVFQSFLVLNN